MPLSHHMQVNSAQFGMFTEDVRLFTKVTIFEIQRNLQKSLKLICCYRLDIVCSGEGNVCSRVGLSIYRSTTGGVPM